MVSGYVVCLARATSEIDDYGLGYLKQDKNTVQDINLVNEDKRPLTGLICFLFMCETDANVL